MYNKAVSIFMSLFIAVMPLTTLIVNAANEESVDNSFVVNYTYEDDIVKSVLTIDGNVCLGGFEGTLNYNAGKYEVDTSNSLNSNVLINVIPTKGEVVISMAASSENLVEASELFCIDFKSIESPETSDFSFEISDTYKFNDKYDAESVMYSIREAWSGLNDATKTTTTTTTTSNFKSTTSTTSVTTIDSSTTSDSTTTSLSSVTTTKVRETILPKTEENKNMFLITVKENKEANTVDVSLSVNGNVEFWTAEGYIEFIFSGLGIPKLSSSISDVLSSYNEESNRIFFSVVSSTGKNITEKQVVFTYSFQITDSAYSISCDGLISDICNQAYEDVASSMKVDNTTSPLQTTSVSTTNSTFTETTSFTKPTATSTTQTSTSTVHVLNVSPFELANWAENDYYKRTGVAPYRSEFTENSDGTLSVSILDEQGNILDTYTINSSTGIGFNSRGEEVNLPQTGNNSLGTIATAVAALALTLIGMFAVIRSGVIRKKNENV